jgi:phosphoglycerate kinase
VGLPTLKDLDLADKRVLVRVDINSPIDPKTGRILDDTRIRSHTPTLEALKASKVVLLAHQSRPGLKDFTTLEPHAKRLKALSGKKVKYVDEVFGSSVRREIEGMEVGEVLVLENVRFCSEEVSDEIIKKPPEDQAKTILVRKLSSYVDAFVNDAFAVAHRHQPSVVAFPQVLPSCAGKLMEREVNTLSGVLGDREKPVFIFGGAKAKDAIKATEHVLKRGIAELVLTSGVVGTVFLAARGYDVGKGNKKLLEEKNMAALVPEAKKLLNRFKGKIETPLDLAFLKNGVRMEAPVEALPDYRTMDIGIETIVRYSNIVKGAKVVVANGPCGVFEIRDFALGTEELMKSLARSNGFSIIGGGHLSAVAQRLNLAKDISYISTGGKATMSFLAGDKLPGIEALKGGKDD